MPNPLYSNYHNMRGHGRGAPRGRGVGMPRPPPPNRRLLEGYIEANDGDIVNPLYTNYHKNTRGRGAPRGCFTNIPPPHILPPHMSPPPNVSTPALQYDARGHGSIDQGGGRGRGFSDFGPARGNNHRQVSSQFEPPPPVEDRAVSGNRQEADLAKKLPPQGRPGDWECGYCGNINFAREDTIFKPFCRTRPTHYSTFLSKHPF